MPSKSPAQARLMRARAHGWKPDRIKGPSVKVAKEFVAADKKVKGYQYGGLAKMLEELKRKQDPNYDPFARYGTEPLTLKQAAKRSGKKGFLPSTMTAMREMGKAGWTPSGEGDDAKWYPPQATSTAPTEGGLAEATEPERTIDPVPGREFISGDAPPRSLAPAAPARTAADIAPGFRPGRVPPTLLRYLEKARAAAGAPEEPVKMQGGGMMNFMFRGRGPQQAMQQMQQRGQPPGGGGRGKLEGSGQGMQRLLQRGQVPGGGGGRGQLGRTMRDALQQVQRRGQPPGGQGQPRPQPPGAGVPLRGVGRPPGMGRPGAGGGHYGGAMQSNMPIRQPGEYNPSERKPGAGGNVQAAVMPGRGFMPTPGPTGGGGGGTPGGANRIGMGDQQGALARAMQTQTGRPPISRRQPFPGRGGPGGGFGRSRRRRGRGRMRR